MWRDYKIMFTGVSGVGKTTIAKEVAESLSIPFISGSYSDLVPETKVMPHSEMIQQDADVVFRQDMQVLNLRNKAFKNQDSFVTDRSYFDSAAYFINKLSHRIPECDIDHAVNLCKMLLSQQCTHLIFIPFSAKFFNDWVTEDNNKRILSKYYQFQVSQIMYGLLELWGYKPHNFIQRHVLGMNYGTMNLLGNEIKVLVLDEMNYEYRKSIIGNFLKF